MITPLTVPSWPNLFQYLYPENFGNETIENLSHEWERSTIAIEECLKSVDSFLENSINDDGNAVDLSVPISILEAHATKISKIYNEVCLRNNQQQKRNCCSCRVNKMKFYAFSALGSLAEAVGLGSLGVDIFKEGDDKTSLRWVGFGLLLSGAILNKVSSFFANAWAKDEKTLGILSSLIAKSSIISNTHATIGIIRYYKRSPLQNDEILRNNVRRLMLAHISPITSLSIPDETVLDSLNKGQLRVSSQSITLSSQEETLPCWHKDDIKDPIKIA